jgi:hypothetical protein
MIIIIATVIMVGRRWRRMPRWLSIAIRRRRPVMSMAVSMMLRTRARRSMSARMSMRRPSRTLGR